jgi:hypothetical protein
LVEEGRPVALEIAVDRIPAGPYLLELIDAAGTLTTTRFVKE